MTIDISRRSPTFERIITDPDQSFHCFSHDYPYNISWNYHPEHEIHLIRRSAGWVFVGDYIGTFGPGHLAFVNSNMPHNWVTETKQGEIIAGRDLVIQFDPELLLRASRVFPEFKKYKMGDEFFSRSWEFGGEVGRQGALLMEQVYDTKGIEKLINFMKLISVLASSKSRQPLATAEYLPHLDKEASSRIDKAIRLIVASLPGEVRMEVIAMHVDMSPTAFSRFFKRNTGHNFVDYMRKLRIGHACRLLSDSERSITEICYDVGYTNLSNFNRSFRADRGITPSTYRRLSRVPNGGS